MGNVNAKIWVSGRVQGVYYRAFTETAANELGLVGYCRNLPDGRVAVEAEGDKTLIEELVKRLWMGPPGAKVTDVQVEWDPATEKFHGFSIEY
jgi:acylphosphatase